MPLRGVRLSPADQYPRVMAQVFSSDSTLWWSPTSAHVAFITFDESDVPLYKYPIYNASPASPAGEVQYEGWEYPKEVGLRYPKVRMPCDLKDRRSELFPQLQAMADTGFLVLHTARLLEPAHHRPRHFPFALPVSFLGLVPLIRRSSLALSPHSQTRPSVQSGRPRRGRD